MSVPSKVREALEAKGRPWEIVEGKRHNKIKIDGRLVGILPRTFGDEGGRGQKNVIAQIRRA